MLGLRLNPDMEASLSRIARREGRTKSDVAREAIRTYLRRVEEEVDLIAEVKRISALTNEADLAYLDELQDDIEQLLREEEAILSARKAA